MMPTTFVKEFGEVSYEVPKIGEHGLLECWTGRHWWTAVRAGDGVAVGIGCPTCGKVLEVHGWP